MEKLKSYIIEFDKNDIMKPKAYPLDYAIRDNYYRPIIIITNNKCIFFVNDEIQKV